MPDPRAWLLTCKARRVAVALPRPLKGLAEPVFQGKRGDGFKGTVPWGESKEAMQQEQASGAARAHTPTHTQSRAHTQNHARACTHTRTHTHTQSRAHTHALPRKRESHIYRRIPRSPAGCCGTAALIPPWLFQHLNCSFSLSSRPDLIPPTIPPTCDSLGFVGDILDTVSDEHARVGVGARGPRDFMPARG